MPPVALRGGLVFRVPSRRLFLPAEVAIKVAPRPQIARFPGAPAGLLGLALVDGMIVPVLELGPDHDAMIVCVHGGEPLGLLGAADITSGMFEARDAGVVVRGEAVPPLDVDEIYTRVRGVTWGATWAG